MKYYIDKSALLAEIKRIMNEQQEICKVDVALGKAPNSKNIEVIYQFQQFTKFLDTLEVKEINVDIGFPEGDYNSKTVQFIDADGNIKEITVNKAQNGKSVLEAAKEEKGDNQNCVKPADKSEQKSFDYESANIQKKDFAPENTPRYSIGDVLCDKSCTTLNKESQPNFEIIDIRNGMYICDKCSFPISQQDEYELVAKRIEQKSTLDFKAKDWYVSKVDGKIHNIHHSVGKVESKFKVGDWITNGDYTWKIIDITPLDYILQSQDGNIVDDTISHVDEQFNLWTIEDAKDGDVLIDKNYMGESPFIFKETKPSNIKTDVPNPLTVLGYCGIGGAGFTKSSGWGDTANCIYYPATKEQRELFFKKMKEAGYQWDADKKELKKISQRMISAEAKEAMYDKPADKVEPKFKIKFAGREYNVLEIKESAGVTFYGIEDEPNHIDYVLPENCEIISGYGVKENGSSYPTKPAVFSEQNPAWSQEDEKMLEDIMSFINHESVIEGLKCRGINYSLDTSARLMENSINWLKALKLRCAWKPNDEQMKALENFIGTIPPYERMFQILKSLYNDLKKLKGE